MSPSVAIQTFVIFFNWKVKKWKRFAILEFLYFVFTSLKRWRYQWKFKRMFISFLIKSHGWLLIFPFESGICKSSYEYPTKFIFVCVILMLEPYMVSGSRESLHPWGSSQGERKRIEFSMKFETCMNFCESILHFLQLVVTVRLP